MTPAIRIQCYSESQIPSAEEIRARIGRERHMVLQFSVKQRVNKSSIINGLAAAMPDYSVFDSGGDKVTEWVTVMPVVSNEIVLTNSAQISHAVMEYIKTCSTMLELIDGKLPAEWSADVHGEHTRLKNSISGQVIEVPLGGPPEPQKVDPYLFAEFVKSTPGLELVAGLITHDFQDAARILRTVFGAKSGT